MQSKILTKYLGTVWPSPVNLDEGKLAVKSK